MAEASSNPEAATQTVSGSIAEESVLAASTGDLPSDEDSLGFEPYVRALAEFLINPSTHGPLTVSVEGEWGSGKSSFMLQLEERLIAIAGGAGPQARHRVPLTVRFNAWRHDKDEALWASFASEFTRRIALQQSAWRRWWGHLVLLWHRFRWREGWLDLLRAVALWTTVFVLASLLFALVWLKGSNALKFYLDALHDKGSLSTNLQTGLQGAGRVGAALAYLTLLLAGFVQLKKYVANPLAVDLKKYMGQPDYAARISFVERFHEDFSRIVDAYAGDKTVYVFIDDLDRCEVPRAAELMQALNLMMSTDRRGLIFIIGMDREKVAAGLAVKNEKLLPYLLASEFRPNNDATAAGSTKDTIDSERGLAFGYNFIEKFIQIPFLVPSPAPQNVGRFFDKLAAEEVAARKLPWLNRFTNGIVEYLMGHQRRMLRTLREKQLSQQAEPATPGGTPRPAAPTPAVTAEAEARRENIKLKVTGDSATVRRIVLSMSPFLGNNPRRVKQFLNLFRLRTFMAAETGLFDGKDGLTLLQLGKFVALSLRWPLLLFDLERYPGLLRALCVVAYSDGQIKPTNVSGPAERASARWRDPVLLALLKSPMTPPGEPSEPSPIFPDPQAPPPSWSLENVDVRRLLQVSPRVRTITLEERQGSQAAAVSQPTTTPAETPTSQSSATTDAPTAAPPSPEVASQHDQERIVFLGSFPADREATAKLQTELSSRGFQVALMESSSAVEFVTYPAGNLTLLCLGSGALQQMKLLLRFFQGDAAIPQNVVPVILESAEGGELNKLLSNRTYFDVREPGGFERLIAYLTGQEIHSSDWRDLEQSPAT